LSDESKKPSKRKSGHKKQPLGNVQPMLAQNPLGGRNALAEVTDAGRELEVMQKAVAEFDHQRAMEVKIRKNWDLLVDTLIAIVRYDDYPPASRVKAAEILLARGFGQPKQTIDINEKKEADNRIEIIIRDGGTNEVLTLSETTFTPDDDGE